MLSLPSERVVVLTTINSDQHSGVQKLLEQSIDHNFQLVIIADQKTPIWKSKLLDKVTFYDLNAQRRLPFEVASYLPENHYSRKNLGYLIAASMGFEWISETDDDNQLLENFWTIPDEIRVAVSPIGARWVNMYALYGYPQLWHRGIPISEVRTSNQVAIDKRSSKFVKVGTVQGFANGDPDIDAICRMLYLPSVKFEKSGAFLTDGGVIAPTNSQLTHWHSRLLPLMYLPCSVLWRVSDIWRGVIAQIWMNSNQWGTLFVGATGLQIRNEHNLLHDFRDEIPVHLHTSSLIEICQRNQKSSVYIYLKNVYSELRELDLVSNDELAILHAFLSDCKQILNEPRNS